MENIDFCIACQKETMYEIEEVSRSRTVNEKEYHYQTKVAYCKECGEEILIPGMLDQDNVLFDKAYRQANGLISITEIQMIMEKYALQKSSLTLVLGFAKGTISRYLQGQMPCSKNNQVLKEVLVNPMYMMELLTKNSNNISFTAYKKAEVHVVKEMAKKQGIHKLEQVVQYIVHQANGITPLALQKLLYFAQGLFLAKYNTYLFIEDCQAWVHGPVYPSVYKKYQEYGYAPIEKMKTEKSMSEMENFLSPEKEILDLVITSFGMYSGRKLEMLTHYEKPWQDARIKVESTRYANQIITKEAMCQYFKEICLVYGMQSKAEVQQYMQSTLQKRMPIEKKS